MPFLPQTLISTCYTESSCAHGLGQERLCSSLPGDFSYPLSTFPLPALLGMLISIDRLGFLVVWLSPGLIQWEAPGGDEKVGCERGWRIYSTVSLPAHAGYVLLCLKPWLLFSGLSPQPLKLWILEAPCCCQSQAPSSFRGLPDRCPLFCK